MTNEELLEIGTADGALVALVSEAGEVVWSAQKSPAGTIVKAMLANEVPGAYALVATQLGAALSTVGSKLGVKRYACRPALQAGSPFPRGCRRRVLCRGGHRAREVLEGSLEGLPC